MANTSQNKLFIISGPSGAGKGTVLDAVRDLVPNMWVSVSMTTRQPRSNDIDGVTYCFATVDEFEKMIAEDGFVEWANVHGNYYGTPLAPIKEHAAQGDAVVLEIDVQGAFQVKEKLPEAQLVFIAPPSLEVLEQRLRARQTDSEESIALRMKNAQWEMEASAEYDIIIVNDKLDEAVQELVNVLQL